MTYECSPGLLNFILGDSTAVLRSLHILFHRSSNIRAAESAHQMHFLRFLREDWGELQNGMYVEGERK